MTFTQGYSKFIEGETFLELFFLVVKWGDYCFPKSNDI
jgi:hypothetical protein